jgi:protein-arginine kinase activator protein McsA
MALRQQLEIAVKNEDYELAAELRDKINRVE